MEQLEIQNGLVSAYAQISSQRFFHNVDEANELGNRKWSDLRYQMVVFKRLTERLKDGFWKVENSAAANIDSLTVLTQDFQSWIDCVKRLRSNDAKRSWIPLPTFPEIHFAEQPKTENRRVPELLPFESQVLAVEAELCNFLIEHTTNFSCNLGQTSDSLILIAIPKEYAIEAGQTAQLSLFILKGIREYKPEFDGSGLVEYASDGGTATLHIKTSSKMIPEGQDEALIPYTANAKLPMADGTLQTLRTVGKFIVRRPYPQKE